MRKITLLLLLPLLLAFTWSFGQRSTQNPVEQQTPGGALQPDRSLWVTNPFPNTCAWDADDLLDRRGFGSLAPGESVEVHECLYADWTQHGVSIDAYARGRGSDSLRVETGWTNVHATRTLVAPPVPAGVRNATTYDTCFTTPDYDHDAPLLEPVPNSGAGGVAQLTDVFFKVTNTSGRLLRDVRVHTSIHVDYSNQRCRELVRETIIPAQLWWFR